MEKSVYVYPRPALAIDVVVFGYSRGQLSILLVKRGVEPDLGNWALPGGSLLENEELIEGARRELKEEAGLTGVFLEQLYTFDQVDRDPRGRVITVAYYALVVPEKHIPVASTDVTQARWFPFEKIPKLAFDHREISLKALERLRGKIRYEPIGFELLPEEFSLTEMQELYETVLGETIDKRNFRKKILASQVLTDLKKKATGLPFRAPGLYRFDMDHYQKLKQKGFEFRL